MKIKFNSLLMFESRNSFSSQWAEMKIPEKTRNKLILKPPSPGVMTKHAENYQRSKSSKIVFSPYFSLKLFQNDRKSVCKSLVFYTQSPGGFWCTKSMVVRSATTCSQLQSVG